MTSALVELTMMIGVENLRSRFNAALGPCVAGLLRVLPGAGPIVTGEVAETTNRPDSQAPGAEVRWMR